MAIKNLALIKVFGSMTAMPITESAKKALRGSRRKRDVNLRRKKDVNETIKKFRKLVAEKKGKEAKELLPQVQKVLDKGAKGGIMKANAAARKKSRFVKMVKKIS
jgi:small subunit ribosomal protein S20